MVGVHVECIEGHGRLGSACDGGGGKRAGLGRTHCRLPLASTRRCSGQADLGCPVGCPVCVVSLVSGHCQVESEGHPFTRQRVAQGERRTISSTSGFRPRDPRQTIATGSRRSHPRFVMSSRGLSSFICITLFNPIAPWSRSGWKSVAATLLFRIAARYRR